MARTALEIAPGFAIDDTVYGAEGLWRDGSLIRFWRGKPQTVGGWQKFTDTAMSGICRGVLSWTDTSGVLNIGMGTHTNLYAWTGGGLYDITPTGLAAGSVDGSVGSGFGSGTFGSSTWGGGTAAEYWPRTWSLDNFGQTLMANPRNGTIYQWSNNVSVVAAAVTNAPTNVTTMLVSNTRQVMAFGCTNVSSVFNPMCIRGSDANAPTSWTPAVGSLAFEVTLSGGGRIVAAKRVGNYIVVWTDNSVYLGTYVGSATQIWKFDKVGEHCGLVGAQAVCVRNQTCFWVGTDLQFRSYTIGGAVQIMVSTVQAQFASNLASNQQDKIVATTLTAFDEVWFFYPDSRDGTENSRYVAFSAADQTIPWFKGQLVRTSFADEGPSQYPIGVDAGGLGYYHELGQSADGARLPWYIESAGQYIGDGDQRMLVKGIWPDFQNQIGTVTLTVYTRGYPQDTEKTKGPFSLTASLSKKDFMADGRVIRFRMEGNNAPSFVRFGKIAVEAVPTGMQ